MSVDTCSSPAGFKKQEEPETGIRKDPMWKDREFSCLNNGICLLLFRTGNVRTRKAGRSFPLIHSR